MKKFCFLILLFFFTTASTYELSICAIFQDEAPYLKEWIEYHRAVGVEHFYLYNDRSSDDYFAVLAPYIEAKIVELEDCFPQNDERHFFNQRRAYVRGLNKAKGNSHWLAIIDLDEFIVPKEADTIQEMLKKYTGFYGVSIRWQKFGTSGYWEIPKDRLMIEALTKKSNPDYEDNWITKSIVQPLLLPDSFFDETYVVENKTDLVHFCKWVQEGVSKMKNSGPLEVLNKTQKMIDLNEAQINHYWCRDEKYYREKKVARKARLHSEDFNTPNFWPEEKVQKYIDLYNECEDYTIQRFVMAVKKRMTAIRNEVETKINVKE